MPKYPFEFIPLPAERSTTKPRTTGLTMMLDFGVPVGRLEDLLTLVGPYVDLIKIAVGTSRIYRETYLGQKILLCEGHHVKPFIGGQFLEYLVATQGFDAADAYFAEAKRVGFQAIEVSDNCVPLTPDQRKGLIAGAVEAGLEVHGEVGSKDVKQTAAELIGQAQDCLEAGAGVVLVEAAEIVVSVPEEAVEPDPPPLLEATELAQLRETVAEMPPKSRVVIALHYFEGLNLRQVAAVLDVRTGTVKSRLNYGLRWLRQRVDLSGS